MTTRQRIEALENGWDKEADDILQEIIEAGYGNGSFIEVSVKIVAYKNVTDAIYVCIKTEGGKKTFEFTSQCTKMQAFKDAWLWLLDKSGLEEHNVGDKIEIKSEDKMYEVLITKKL